MKKLATIMMIAIACNGCAIIPKASDTIVETVKPYESEVGAALEYVASIGGIPGMMGNDAIVALWQLMNKYYNERHESND